MGAGGHSVPLPASPENPHRDTFVFDFILFVCLNVTQRFVVEHNDAKAMASFAKRVFFVFNKVTN